MTNAAHHFRRWQRSLDDPAGSARLILQSVAFALLLGVGPLAASGAQDPYEILASIGLERDVKQGYVLRADTWGGDLPIDGSKRIEHTLLRGNDYRFYAYASTKGAKISFHVQDRDGSLVEAHSWQQEKDGLWFAGADITPKATGSYYLVVKIEQSPVERADWALIYAYK